MRNVLGQGHVLSWARRLAKPLVAVTGNGDHKRVTNGWTQGLMDSWTQAKGAKGAKGGRDNEVSVYHTWKSK